LTPSAVAAPAPNKRHITEKDLFDFVWIGDPQMSADGARVAFVRVTANKQKTGKTELYVVPEKGAAAKLLTTIAMGARGLAPSPDGKRAAFIASPNEPINSYSQPERLTTSAGCHLERSEGPRKRSCAHNKTPRYAYVCEVPRLRSG
jgi:dipeptidyl aminopeptidase/acylaminoacyl peptidase